MSKTVYPIDDIFHPLHRCGYTLENRVFIGQSWAISIMNVGRAGGEGEAEREGGSDEASIEGEAKPRLKPYSTSKVI